MSKRKSTAYSGTAYVIPIENLTGTNLPSNRDVLGLMQYRLLHYHESTAEAVRCVVKEVEALWHNHNIPTKQSQTSGAKLKKLHAKVRSVRKNSAHAGAKQKEIESIFRDQLNELFDIAHYNALGTMENADERQFLISQRRMGTSERELESGKRRKVDEAGSDPLQTSVSATSDFAAQESGHDDDVDDVNDDSDSNSKEAILVDVDEVTGDDDDVDDVNDDSDSNSKDVVLVDEDEVDDDPLLTSGSPTSDFAGDESENGDNDNEDDYDNDGSDSFSHSDIHPSTSYTYDESTKKNIMTSHLATALDRVGLSDKDTIDVISAVLTSAGHNLDDFTLSLQSISRARAEYRESIAGEKWGNLSALRKMLFNMVKMGE